MARHRSLTTVRTGKRFGFIPFAQVLEDETVESTYYAFTMKKATYEAAYRSFSLNPAIEAWNVLVDSPAIAAKVRADVEELIARSPKGNPGLDADLLAAVAAVDRMDARIDHSITVSAMAYGMTRAQWDAA